jgi:ABC-type transport system involved in multi-copper enzyme maturation permease subunit
MSDVLSETARATGTIHDLGYQRYVGARLSVARRWRVVMRNQMATAWKTWWRYKAALAITVLATCIAAGVMVIFSDKLVRGLIGATAVTLADAALPKSIEWYTRAGFLVSLTVGAHVVAGDRQSGAFTFYFARSVRPRDYVVGKLAGMLVLMAMIHLAGPLVLSLVRLGLAGDVDELVGMLHLVPKALAIGLLGALVFATVPVAFSALLAKPRHAIALWAAYYLVFGSVVSGLGHLESTSWLGALDLPTALDAVAYALFDLKFFGMRALHLDPTIAVVSLLAHVGVAIAIVSVQVRRAHGHGVGGAT